MFFGLNDQQRDLESTLHAYLERACPTGTLVARVGRSGESDLELHRELCRQLDVLGLLVPQQKGGSGAGFGELFVLFREFGRVLYSGSFLPSLLAAELLSVADDSARPELDALLRGDAHGAVAGLTWDDSTGLTARHDGTQWTVTGRCPHVLADATATTLVLLADTEDGLGPFLVADPSSVHRTPLQTMDPGRPLAHLTFDNVLVRPLADPASGNAIRERLLTVAAIALGAEQVGVAERCLEMTLEHAKVRYQFGRPIGSFQAVKHHCANAALALEGARATAFNVARELDTHRVPSPWSVNLAKSICTEASTKVASIALQVFGGIGFTWEHPLHLYFKRGVSTRELFGSTLTHRDIVATGLLKHGR